MSFQDSKKRLYESLCDLQIPSTICFSPNAQQIVYATQLEWNHKFRGKQHPVSNLWLASPGNPDSARQITSGLYNDRCPRWSPNNKSIAFSSDRADAGKKWAIYTLNLSEGGEAVPLTDPCSERDVDAFDFSPHGNVIAFVSADEPTEEDKKKEEAGENVEVWGENWAFSRLRTIDVETKEVKCLTGNDDSNKQHVVAFAWSPDGKQIAIATTKSPDIEEEFLTGTDISIVTLADGSLRDVCHLPKELNEDRKLLWSAEDGKLYFCSGLPLDKTQSGRAVYSLDPSQFSSSPKRVAFGEINDAVDAANVSNGGGIIVKVQSNLHDEIYLLQPSSCAPKLLFSKPQEIEHFAATYTRDSDEILLAITTSSIDSPTELYTTTASGGAFIQLSSHGSSILSTYPSFGTCLFVSCPSTDTEVTLHGVFLTPTSSSPSHAAPKSTIVLIHGGPADRITDRFNTYYYYWTPYLLAQGYSILLPNYRGSLGKGKPFASYSAKGQGKYDHADVLTLTDHAITNLKLIDPERVMVGGLSQGGFLSYLCATRNGLQDLGWKFKAAIPLAGVVDADVQALTSDLGGTVEMELSDDRAPWLVSRHDTRNRDAGALWEFSHAIAKGKELGPAWREEGKGHPVIPPMLILHGEKDERCPVSNAVGMRRALMSADLPFEYVIYPRQAHIFEERFAWVDMMMRVDRWCERYIGPGEKRAGATLVLVGKDR